MQEITHSYHRSEAPSPEIWGLFRSEEVAGLARARWCWVWWTARLAMTDYARNHAQLSQVRGTFAGDLGPLPNVFHDRTSLRGRTPDGGCPSNLACPVDPAESLHPSKLGGVCSDDCQPSGQCLPSDEQIIRADRRSALLQGGADPACGLGVLVVKGHHVHVTGQEDTETFGVLRHVGAFLHSIPQLEQNHRGDREVISGQLRRPESLPDGGWPVPQQCDDGVGVQKVVHPNKSSAPGIGGWFLPSSRNGTSAKRSSSANHASTSVAMGSSCTPSPTWRTRTRSPGSRNSFGSRTAWFRPCMKSLAIAVSAMTPPRLIAIKSVHQIVTASISASRAASSPVSSYGSRQLPVDQGVVGVQPGSRPFLRDLRGLRRPRWAGGGQTGSARFRTWTSSERGPRQRRSERISGAPAAEPTRHAGVAGGLRRAGSFRRFVGWSGKASLYAVRPAALLVGADPQRPAEPGFPRLRCRIRPGPRPRSRWWTRPG